MDGSCFGQGLSSMNYVLDKSCFGRVQISFRKAEFGKLTLFRGHKGSYCQDNCDPYSIEELEGVNTVVCEQVTF